MTILQQQWKRLPHAALVSLLLAAPAMAQTGGAPVSDSPSSAQPSGGKQQGGATPSSQPTSAQPSGGKQQNGGPVSSEAAGGGSVVPPTRTDTRTPEPPPDAGTRSTGTQPASTQPIPAQRNAVQSGGSAPASAQPTEIQRQDAGHQNRPAGKMPFKRMRLDNGLEVIVIENRSVPLVTVDVTVRNGAFTESDEYAGLSHLYEHMFFKANAAIPSQELFMQRVRHLGIVFNGYTSDEVVTYFFTLPSSNLEAGMKFMADAITSPLFTEEELKKEREVVLGEFDRNEAQPAFGLWRAVDSALWMPYVSRKQPLGQRQVIQNATVEQMRMIKDRFYHPNNSALIISGDVNAQEIFTLAKNYFASWNRGPDPFPTYTPPAFPARKPTLVVRPAAIPDVEMGMVFHGPSLGKDEPDTYAARLLATLLNQPTSRFFHRMIDSSVVLEADANYSNASNTGAFGFYLTSGSGNARRAVDLLKEEIAAMKEPGYFSAEEIETAKKIIADRQTFDRETPYSFATRTIARWWSMASPNYYLELPDNVATVTEAGLRQFVGKYLVGKPFVLGVGAEASTLNTLNFSEEALQW